MAFQAAFFRRRTTPSLPSPKLEPAALLKDGGRRGKGKRKTKRRSLLTPCFKRPSFFLSPPDYTAEFLAGHFFKWQGDEGKGKETRERESKHLVHSSCFPSESDTKLTGIDLGKKKNGRCQFWRFGSIGYGNSCILLRKKILAKTRGIRHMVHLRTICDVFYTFCKQTYIQNVFPLRLTRPRPAWPPDAKRGTRRGTSG